MSKTILVLLLALTCCVSASARQDKPALAQILKSETEAAKLVEDLRSYAAKCPWGIEVMSTLAQRNLYSLNYKIQKKRFLPDALSVCEL
jgi:hypothetical protein